MKQGSNSTSGGGKRGDVSIGKTEMKKQGSLSAFRNHHWLE